MEKNVKCFRLAKRTSLWRIEELSFGDFKISMEGRLILAVVVVVLVLVGVSLAVRKDSSGCRQESTVFLRDCHCDPVFFFTPTMRCFALWGSWLKQIVVTPWSQFGGTLISLFLSSTPPTLWGIFEVLLVSLVWTAYFRGAQIPTFSCIISIVLCNLLWDQYGDLKVRYYACFAQDLKNKFSFWCSAMSRVTLTFVNLTNRRDLTI